MVQPGVCTAPPQGGLGRGHENRKRGVIACPEGPVPKERDCRSRQSSWAERKVHAARGLSSGCRALKILGICCVWCAKEMPLGGRAGEAAPEGFKLGAGHQMDPPLGRGGAGDWGQSPSASDSVSPLHNETSESRAGAGGLWGPGGPPRGRGSCRLPCILLCISSIRLFPSCVVYNKQVVYYSK